MSNLYFTKTVLYYLFFSIVLLSITIPAYAQTTHEGITYQAIARDINGKPIKEKTLSVRLTIWNDSSLSATQLPDANSPFEQISNITTNRYGLFTLIIGADDTTDFKNIPWGSSGIKYLQVDIDTTGTGGSWVEMKPRSPLMSVPYALYAKYAANATNADSAWSLNGNILQDTTSYIGTKNLHAFVIRTNDIPRMRVASNGNVSILNNVNIATQPSGIELEFYSLVNDEADIRSNTQMNIGTSANKPFTIVTNNNTAITVDSAGNTGIGTITPTTKLDIAGKIKITDGTEGTGKILVSDATGTASWTTILDTGTVVGFSADSLLPLFSTSVNNSTVSPHLDFQLANVTAYTIFGNTTGATTAPTYFNPVLASALFQNQGSTNAVLHGNTAGNPSWGQITNNDIASGTIDLSSKVTGVLPMSNGGTSSALTPINGAVVYSDATSMQLTAQGTHGQRLSVNNTGLPVWVNDTTITALTPVNILTLGTNKIISVLANSLTNSGIVTAGLGSNNKVWKTDALGNPAWRDDAGNYTIGTGLSVTGNTLNSVWTRSGNNIENNNTGNVNIKNGNLSVNGASGYSLCLSNDLDTNNRIFYSGATNGLNFKSSSQMHFNNGFYTPGNVGIGETAPSVLLHVKGSPTETTTISRIENINTGNNNPTVAIFNTAGGDALNIAQTGVGNGLSVAINNPNNVTSAISVASNGGSNSKALNVSHTGSTGLIDYGVYSKNTGTGTGTTNVAGYFSAENASMNYAAIFDQGYVGIGTQTPISPLHLQYNIADSTKYGVLIQNTNNTTTAHASLVLYNNGSHHGGITFLNSPNNIMRVGTITNAVLQLTTNKRPRVTIDTAGRMGVGTIAPAMKLDVRSTSGKITNTANVENVFQIGSSDSSPLALRLGIKTDGTGTNRYATIDVDDGGSKRDLILQPSGGAKVRVGGDFNVAGNTLIAGNVGINCPSPQYLLHVGGDVGILGDLRATGVILALSGVTSCSDMRYKKDIIPLQNALANVLKMNGVNYYWKTEAFPEEIFTKDKQIGFIAQDIEKLYPEVVHTGKDGYKSVDYSKLTPILVEAMKEQQTMIDGIKKQNEQQQAIIELLQKEVEVLKKK